MGLELHCNCDALQSHFPRQHHAVSQVLDNLAVPYMEAAVLIDPCAGGFAATVVRLRLGLSGLVHDVGIV